MQAAEKTLHVIYSIPSDKLIDLIFYFRSSDERTSPGQGRLATQATIATQGCNGRTISVLKWIKAKHCWTLTNKLIQIKMFSSSGVLKKIKWKSGVHLSVTIANYRSIRLLHNKFHELSPSGGHHSLLFDQGFPNNARLQRHLANRNATWRFDIDQNLLENWVSKQSFFVLILTTD